MEHDTSFDTQKAELLELIKGEPTASVNWEGLTPLQIRLLGIKLLTLDETKEEEELCAELCNAVLALDEVQVDRFVKYVLQAGFDGDYLRLQYNDAYIQMMKTHVPPLDPIVVGLLTAMTLNIGGAKLVGSELLNDPVLTELKTKDADLWLELLYQSNWNLFEEELIDRFDMYGYEVLALGRERWLDEGRCDLERLAKLVHKLSNSLEDSERGWMEDFIAKRKAK